MGAVNTRGYIRIYMGLFDNSISFNSPSDSLMIGDTLLQFIYFDFNKLVNRACVIKDFELAHPYFTLCDSLWQESFISRLNDNIKNGTTSELDKLKLLQEQYTSLLLKLYNHSTGFDASHLIENLQTDHWFQNNSCFVRLSLKTTKDENKTSCKEEFFVSSIEECLFIEFIEILKRKIVIKNCKNCNRMFIPKRTNMDYCSRIYTNDGKTCSDVGYTQTFARNVKNDDLLLAYTRSYKAHYARMTKPRKRMSNMTRDEFETWYHEAKKKLEQARAGLIDAESFKNWLKE